MRAAKEPTERMRPRLRAIMPGTTSFVTLRVALLSARGLANTIRGGPVRHLHVNLDDIGDVLVREILVEGRLVVALADVVDWKRARISSGDLGARQVAAH